MSVRQSESERGRVVYSRNDSATGTGVAKSAWRRIFVGKRKPFAPALPPLLAGLTLLLVLVVGLGVLSNGRLQAVSTSILDLQRQSSDRLNLVLKMSAAITSLNNEARARAAGRARREITPPFNLRLRSSREDVKALLPRFESLPIAQTDQGRALRDNLASFVETSQNPDLYEATGYEKFRALDGDLNSLIEQLSHEQENVFRRSEEWRSRAAREILILTAIAFALGLVATLGTALEVQRRFRQMRRSLEDARRERQFSTQMLGGMVSAVAAIDGTDRIRSANRAFFQIFPDAAIGSSIHEKVAPPPVMQILEVATAQRPSAATYLGRWKVNHLVNADDSLKSFDVYSSPLLLDGDAGMLLTLVDATEAAKAEIQLRQRASLAAVGQAVAQVAHEIKNPIGSIRLGISMVREMIKDSDALMTINLVDRGIDHLNKLTEEITHFSRQKPLTRVETDLVKLLNTSLELVADKIGEKHANVRKDYSEETMTGLWDEDELRQVFVNLFGNALDASGDGAVLAIATERVAQNNIMGTTSNGHQTFARITITDRGSGMDEKTRARIFEPFFTTKKRGTGLGLAVVKKIIDQHEGHISVASRQQEGTRFAIELPLSD